MDSRFHPLHNPSQDWSSPPAWCWGQGAVAELGMHRVVQKAQPWKDHRSWVLLLVPPGPCLGAGGGHVRWVSCAGKAALLGGRLAEEGWASGPGHPRPHPPPPLLLPLPGTLPWPNALTPRSEQPRIRQRLSRASVCYAFCLWQVQELSCTGKRRAERHPSVLFDGAVCFSGSVGGHRPQPFNPFLSVTLPQRWGFPSPQRLRETFLPTPRAWRRGQRPQVG